MVKARHIDSGIPVVNWLNYNTCSLTTYMQRRILKTKYSEDYIDIPPD